MTIPYRTQRALKRLLVVILIVAVIFAAVWGCWLLWVQRYIIYTAEGGAKLDFNLPPMAEGQLAVPPEEVDIPIYFNEGEAAVTTNTELTQLNGYYVEPDALSDISAVKSQIQSLKAGTAVMIDVKNIRGGFYYSSTVSDTRTSAVDIAQMDDLISYLKRSGMYTIARLPAFRDYTYGLNHVPDGVPHSSGGYLYQDDEGCYWLNPGSEGTLSFLSQVIMELKDLGFDEVVLYDFCFPETTNILVNGDKTELLSNAANILLTACSTNSFAVSFEKTADFTVPQGRSRIYLRGLEAAQAAGAAADSGVADTLINLVFLTELHDTRFDAYSVMRPLSGAH